MQINLNRCAAAHDLAFAKSRLLKADFIAMSEPNENKTKNKRYTYVNETRAVTNLVLEYGAGNCYLWVKTREAVIYSAYISPNIEFTKFLQSMEELRRSLANRLERVVVTGDFNAKYVDWGRDRRKGNSNA